RTEGRSARSARRAERFTELFRLAFILFGVIVAALANKDHVVIACGFFAAGMLAYVVMRWALARFLKELRVHERERARLVDALARLRGVRIADERVRVDDGSAHGVEADSV